MMLALPYGHSESSSSTATAFQQHHRSQQARHYFTESTPSSLPPKRPSLPNLLPRSKNPRLENQNSILDIVDEALHLLRRDLDQRRLASDAFPQEPTPSEMQASIARYEERMNSAAKQGVCSSCGRLMAISEIVEVNTDYSLETGYWKIQDR
jgi:hypothetical protein